MTSPGGYSAGTIFLQVVPSFRNFQDTMRKAAREADKAFAEGMDSGEMAKAFDAALEKQVKKAEKDGTRLGKALSSQIKRQLDTAFKGISSALKVTVDDDAVTRRLLAIQGRIEAMDATIDVDIDLDGAREAQGELDDILMDLQEIRAMGNLDIRLESNVDQIMAGIRKLNGELGDAIEGNKKKAISAAEATGQGILSAFDRVKRDLGPVMFSADGSAATNEARIIVARIQSMLERSFEADFDISDKGTVAAMQRMVDQLYDELRALDGTSADVNVNARIAKAVKDLAAVARQAENLDGKRAEVEVDIDSSSLERFINRSSGASEALRGFSGVALGVAAVGPALIPVLAASAAALTGLGVAALGAASGLGVMILGFSGVGEAVKQMQKVEEDAQQITERRRVSAERIADAQRGVADAERSAARAARDAAEANEEAAKRVADARARLAQAEKDAARDIADAQRNEADARQALVDAQEEAARATEESAERVAKARQRLADVTETATEREQAAAERVAVAQQRLVDAQETAVERAERAAERIADARQRLADTIESAAEREQRAAENVEAARRRLDDVIEASAEREQAAVDKVGQARDRLAQETERASRQIESALRSQREAELRLTETVEDATRAQQALIDARREAAHDLEDLEDRVISGRLSEEAAVISLQESLEDLNELRANPDATERDIRKAEIAYARQAQSLDELRTRNQRLAQEQAEAVEAGVEGSERVQSAQERLNDTLDRQVKAQEAVTLAAENAARVREESAAAVVRAERAIADAETELAKVRADNVQAIADATTALSKAQTAQAKQQRDSARDIAEAVETVNDAVAEQTKQQEASARAIAEAQKGVTKAVADQEKQQRDSARAIAEAHEGVTDALADQAQQQKDSARDIADAQRDVQDAVVDTAQAQERAAEQVKAAQDGVAEAVRNAARTQRDGAESVADAQRRVGDAMRAVREAAHQAGLEGSASIRNLQNAMDDLSPAGQRFALFLYDLRDEFQKLRAAAQEGLLPGVEQALRNILPFMPQITGFVSTMAKAMGDLFVQASKTFTSPIWLEFFGMLGRLGPIFAQQFGDVMLNLLTIFAQISTAFAPLAVRIGDALVSLTDRFSKFLDSQAGREAFQRFLGYVDKIGPTVVSFFVAFGRALGNMLVAVAPYGETFLKLLTGILNWIAEMDPKTLGVIIASLAVLVVTFNVLAGFVGVIGVLTNVVKGLMAVLSVGAGTATLIAGAIALLAVGLVILYTKSETARDIINAVFGAIARVWEVKWAILKAGFEAMGALFDTVARGMTWLWENLLSPAFDAGGKAIQYVWENFIKPVFDLLGSVFLAKWEHILKPTLEALGLLFGAIFVGMKWAWDNILWPVLQAIGTVIQTVWTTLIKPALDAFALVFGATVTAIKWAYDNVLGPVIQLIGKVIWELFKWFFEPVFKEITNGWGAMMAAMKYLWNLILLPLITGIGKAWNTHLASPFAKAMEQMGNAWNLFKDMAGASVKFVVETVLNNGLIKGYNKLADFFKTDRISNIPVPNFQKSSPAKSTTSTKGGHQAFAAGGSVLGFSPTPTADNIPAMLTAGEYVLPVNAVKRLKEMYGDQFLEWLRKGGGYAKGGLVEFGRLLQSRNFRVSEHPAFGGVRGKHAPKSYHYSGQAIDVNYGPGGTNAIEQRAIDGIIGLAKEYNLRTIWRTTGHFNHAHFDTGGAKGSMIGNIGSFLGDLKDFAGGVISKPLNWLGEQTRSLFGPILDNPFGEMLKGGAEKLISGAVNKISGAMAAAGDFVTNKGEDAPKRGYAHGGPVKLYDNGGMLPPGLTTVLNATGRPEPVFSPEQWATIAQGGVAGGVQHIEGTLDLGDGLVGYVEGVIDGRNRRERQVSRARMG